MVLSTRLDAVVGTTSTAAALRVSAKLESSYSCWKAPLQTRAWEQEKCCISIRHPARAESYPIWISEAVVVLLAVARNHHAELHQVEKCQWEERKKREGRKATPFSSLCCKWQQGEAASLVAICLSTIPLLFPFTDVCLFSPAEWG